MTSPIAPSRTRSRRRLGLQLGLLAGFGLALEQSRWQAAVAAVQELVQPGSFLSQNTHIALIRFGHDPEPD